MKRIAAALLLCLSAACNSTDEPLLPCDEPVLITVGSGTTPQFAWQPACLISRVTVTDSIGTVLWDVQATGSSIPPAVPYGELPDGATQLTAPVALIAGRSYAVGLYRATGVTPGDVELLSAVAFRP